MLHIYLHAAVNEVDIIVKNPDGIQSYCFLIHISFITICCKANRQLLCLLYQNTIEAFIVIIMLQNKITSEICSEPLRANLTYLLIQGELERPQESPEGHGESVLTAQKGLLLLGMETCEAIVLNTMAPIYTSSSKCAWKRERERRCKQLLIRVGVDSGIVLDSAAALRVEWSIRSVMEGLVSHISSDILKSLRQPYQGMHTRARTHTNTYTWRNHE